MRPCPVSRLEHGQATVQLSKELLLQFGRAVHVCLTAYSQPTKNSEIIEQFGNKIYSYSLKQFKKDRFSLGARINL